MIESCNRRLLRVGTDADDLSVYFLSSLTLGVQTAESAFSLNRQTLITPQSVCEHLLPLTEAQVSELLQTAPAEFAIIIENPDACFRDGNYILFRLDR